MGRRALAPGAAAALGAALLWAVATAQTAPPQTAPPPYAAEQIQLGARLYARNCSPCHGARMQDPQGAFDLRQFPHDQPERFRQSVEHGKNQMPPWGGLLKPEEIDALWAYVTDGGSP